MAGDIPLWLDCVGSHNIISSDGRPEQPARTRAINSKPGQGNSQVSSQGSRSNAVQSRSRKPPLDGCIEATSALHSSGCPGHQRTYLLVALFRLSIVASAGFFVAAQETQDAQKWCYTDKEPNVSTIEICLEPSVGPMTGGSMVTIKGMHRAADSLGQSADWESKCNEPSWWFCTFATPAV